MTTPAIRVSHLWKLFGPERILRTCDRPETFPEALKAGAAAVVRVCDLWTLSGPERILRTCDRAETFPEALQAGAVAAVRDLSFAVAPGEIFVVMGLSGSGKSTLIRSLLRLIEPTWGRVEV